MILTGSDLAALKSSLEFWEIVEYVSTATSPFAVQKVQKLNFWGA